MRRKRFPDPLRSWWSEWAVVEPMGSHSLPHPHKSDHVGSRYLAIYKSIHMKSCSLGEAILQDDMAGDGKGAAKVG